MLKTIGSWVAGIAASVIAALLVWHFTRTPPAPPPQPDRPSPTMGELLLKTNLQGHDIENLDNSSISTAGDCSNLCLQHSNCVAMTFVAHASGVGGVCWLKDAVPQATFNANMTSAVKNQP